MTVDKEVEKLIRAKIVDFEYYSNGFQHSGDGNDVMIVNLDCQKDKAIADVILTYPTDGRKERFNKCEYPYSELGINPQS